MRKVIFLDIDGVLLPFPNPCTNQEKNQLFPTQTLEALQIIWEHTNRTTSSGGAEWILSSTWRVQPEYIQQIEQALQDFGIPLVFAGITDPTLHSERQWEIYEWFVVHQETKSIVWLALDDEELLEGETNEKHRKFFEGHTVLTKSHCGLTRDDANRAIQLWDSQLSDNAATVNAYRRID